MQAFVLIVPCCHPLLIMRAPLNGYGPDACLAQATRLATAERAKERARQPSTSQTSAPLGLGLASSAACALLHSLPAPGPAACSQHEAWLTWHRRPLRRHSRSQPLQPGAARCGRPGRASRALRGRRHCGLGPSSRASRATSARTRRGGLRGLRSPTLNPKP